MGISIWNLLIIAVIVALVFGTSRLRNVGKDLGEAVKGFKDAVDDGEKEVKESQKQIEDSSIIESEAVNKTEEKEEQK